MQVDRETPPLDRGSHPFPNNANQPLCKCSRTCDEGTLALKSRVPYTFVGGGNKEEPRKPCPENPLF